MNKTKKTSSKGLTRRDLLKVSGLALGGLAFGGAMVGVGTDKALAQQECPETNGCGYPVDDATTQEYTYPQDYNIGPFYLEDQKKLEADEMRITFLGTAFPPSRRVQSMMSIFVEVGPWKEDPGGGFGKATDSFVFDCGVGTLTNYTAMGIATSRMDKIFLSHLHADHMSDLSAIYCFGPSWDRKWPLYVWGHGPSEVQNPNPPRQLYDDGTNAFCRNLREAMRWHTESFSFLKTGYRFYRVPTREMWGTPCDLVPVGDDSPQDGYGLVPIELHWREVGGVAYNNPTTGVKITHFPVIHCRQGSMGYKLEWNGLSMIYTSDTRPETNCIEQAKNVDPVTGQARGVDVFIHEMILPPELLAMKNMGLTWPDYSQTGFSYAVKTAKKIEDSSHTPQGAYGYLLSQINPRPKLSVIAHFPVANDTVSCARNSVQAHFPNENYPILGQDIIWATDLMVLTVKKGENGGSPQITQQMGQVTTYTFGAPQNVLLPYQLYAPKYPTPTAQLDQATLIESGDDTYCKNGY